MPKIFNKLKSLPLTIVLTVLIWMYAEAQFTTTQDNLPITIHVTPIANDQSIRILEPADGQFRVSVEGPQTRVEQFRQLRPDQLESLDFTPSQKLPLGSKAVIDSATVINSLPYFHNNGLTVTAASPANIRLDVDPLAQFSKLIVFRGAIPVTITPDHADLMMPQSLLDGIGGKGHVNVYARPLKDLDSLPQGVEQTIPAQLLVDYAAPTDERVVVSPQQVTLTLTMPRQREQSLVIPEVSIYVSGPPDMLSKYNTEIRPRAVQITLGGPDKLLEPLRAAMGRNGSLDPSARIHAYIDLDPNDKPSDTFTQRALRFVYPPGLELRQSPDHVEFRLIPEQPTTQPTTDTGH